MSHNSIYLALGLISAAMLAWQVALTRFFALAQGSHLAFMAISLALLGLGASGTYLSLKPPTHSNLPRRLSQGTLLFALSVPVTYLAVNYLPFDAYRLAWEPGQWLWLALYYLALTVPFFFGGLVIGAALVADPGRAGLTYAANLLGSAVGPPLALLALATVGGPGTVFFCALLGWLALGGCHWQVVSYPFCPKGRKLTFMLYLAGGIGLLYLTLLPPALFEVRLNPYKSLSQTMLYPGSEIVFSRWNAYSRVDVVRSAGIHSAPGLSFAYSGDLPPQLGLVVDGDNLTPITQPAPPTLSHYLPLTLGFELRPAADALILEPGGGLAVLVALQNGAKTVTVVQSNHTVAEVVGHYFADFNHNLYDDPRVSLVVDEPRSFLRRTERQFDLILFPLTDSFHPVTAGAYTLNEDYRYTVEAMGDALSQLKPNGLLLVERWLQLPPTESVRLWATAITAMRLSLKLQPRLTGPEADLPTTLDPAKHLLALRSLQTSLVGVARSPLSSQDLATIRTFARQQQFDLDWLPDLQPAETNRYSILAEPLYRPLADLLAAPNPAAFFAAYPYAVAPTSDDYPFFFHFFKWSQTPQIIQALGKTWQPFGGSGYLVLVVLLALVLIFSAILMLLPLLWWQRKDQEISSISLASSSLRYLLYFALLGLGFLFVEIPLLQRFILYLGQPAYAFAVVIPALLLASGVGSGYLSRRLSLRTVLPLISLLTLLYPALLPGLFEATLPLPFWGRVMVACLVLFPLGLLLGIPFPRGLAVVGQHLPQLTPWIWAVNGCTSVVSAVLAALLALTWGFTAVLWSAALAYGLAGWVIWSLDSSPRSFRGRPLRCG
jgi:hypothetical protein